MAEPRTMNAAAAATLLLLAAAVAAQPITLTAGDDWRPVDLSRPWPEPGSALDMSALVAREPAGSLGRVIVAADGHLAFERAPDRRVRFFGCSLAPEFLFTSGGLPDKAAIETFAERIRRQGYNLVRPHFLDHALTRGATADLAFDAQTLDRFEYFVACCRQRGIYLYLDAMTSWKGYTKAPAWTAAAGAVDLKNRMYWDPTARAHWEQGVRQLLTHTNPYTGTRLADDPQVAVVLGFNEQEINAWSRLPEWLTEPWRAFLRARYPSIEALRAAWRNEQGRPLTEAASFDAVPLFGTTSLWERNQRGVDAELFLIERETEMTRYYIERLRAMGYRGLISQFDYLKGLRHAVPRNLTEAVSMHGYHDHPTDFTTPGSSQKQTSSLADAANWFRGMATTRLADRPFLLTEYGHVYWNRYRYEEGLVMGAYSALGDHDCLMAHAGPVVDRAGAIKPFAVGHDPIGRAAQVVSGFLFARRDAEPSGKSVVLSFGNEELHQPAAIHGGVGSEQSWLPLVTGFGLSYSGNQPSASIKPRAGDVTLRLGGGAQVFANGAWAALLDEPGGKAGAAELLAALKAKGIVPPANATDPAAGRYESLTGQILLDSRAKSMTVRTPRLEGVSFETLPAPARLGVLTVVASSVPANVTAIAVDGAELAASRRILLVYATDAQNSGAQYDDPERRVLRKLGGLPVLLRTGRLELSLAVRQQGRPRAWALGFDGRRGAELPVRAEGVGLGLTIDTRTVAGDVTPFFELVVEER